MISQPSVSLAFLFYFFYFVFLRLGFSSKMGCGTGECCSFLASQAPLLFHPPMKMLMGSDGDCGRSGDGDQEGATPAAPTASSDVTSSSSAPTASPATSCLSATKTSPPPLRGIELVVGVDVSPLAVAYCRREVVKALSTTTTTGDLLLRPDKQQRLANSGSAGAGATDVATTAASTSTSTIVESCFLPLASPAVVFVCADILATNKNEEGDDKVDNEEGSSSVAAVHLAISEAVQRQHHNGDDNDQHQDDLQYDHHSNKLSMAIVPFSSSSPSPSSSSLSSSARANTFEFMFDCQTFHCLWATGLNGRLRAASTYASLLATGGYLLLLTGNANEVLYEVV